jgi:hypothetical protein
MTRFFLTVLLPLVLPTVLYVLWSGGLVRAGQPGQGGQWRELPWTWLAALGIILAGCVVIAVVQIGGSRGGLYIPPHLQNGVVVPGHVEPAGHP